MKIVYSLYEVAAHVAYFWDHITNLKITLFVMEEVQL